MPTEQFIPEDDARRLSPHPTPNLPGEEPALLSVRPALQRRGPKGGGAGAPLTQAGAPAPDTHLGPTVAYGTSVRSRAASPTTTRDGATAVRRIIRTIQHLIVGSLASQRVARANAASASVTLEARREDREGVDAYLAAHHATRAQAAARPSSAETNARGRPGGWAGLGSPGAENLPGEWPRVSAPRTGEEAVADMSPLDPAQEVGPRLPGSRSAEGRWVLRHADQDAGQDHLHNDSQHNSQGSVMVPSPRDAPITGTAVEVDPEPRAAAAAVVTETVASALEGVR